MDSPNQDNQKDNKNLTNRTPLDFFGEDRNFLFIFKKTEKLVSAVYIVSDLFPQEEPLKWRLREEALELMSLAIPLKDKLSDSRKKELVSVFKSQVLETTALLEVAYFSGLLGEMNFSVLRQEFSNLLNAVDARLDPVRHSPLLFPSDFFSAGKSESPSEDEKRRQELLSQRQLDQSKTTETEKTETENTEIKDKGQSKKEIPKLELRPSKNIQPKVSDKKSSRIKNKREDLITDLIKKKKEVTIKDISKNIKGCSEKTIQRALISLVKKGVLKKEGERRWSKYSLK